MHIPVLIDKVIEFLKPKENRIYIDATLGCGGYTEKILNVSKGCKIIGIDWDSQAIEYSKERLKDFLNNGDVIIVKDNFINLKKILKDLKISQVDGVIFDFGLSTLQIKSCRGFSFNDDTLDMRMSDSFGNVSAYDVVNKFSKQHLTDIFYSYGEEKFGRLIAKKIVEYRKNKEIKSAKQLSEIVESLLHSRTKKLFLKNSKQKVKLKFHPATKIFQAIRIFVNNELKNIEIGVNDAIDVLSSSGRVIAICYHSLEDRIVKNIFKNRSDCKVITKKPVVASDEEIKFNRSARSAKLRVVEKL
ncbi:MAG: 16S rRNA (cytosine(1402)-N(4))-methyltransferase RsmH [Endomicrobiia bacterium]